MLTLRELLNGVKCLDENTLAELSDKLWELGTLDDIKEKEIGRASCRERV